MIFSILYNVGLGLLALLALPRLLYQRIAYGKYRSSFPKRLAKAYPEIDKAGRKLFWIHAVSVGETKAVAALAHMIKERHPEHILVISSITETGHAEAKRSLPFADYHLYLPLDFSWTVRSVLRKITPDVVILCETDFWYHFLQGCKSLGAKLYVVNGKMSARTAGRLKFLPWFVRRVWGLMDIFCVQAEVYRTRLLEVGVDSERVVVTGNIKFDAEYPKMSPANLQRFRAEVGIGHGDPVLVVGSTHDPEEKRLIPIFERLWDYLPNLKVVLVPRHPERFDAVAALLKAQGIRFKRYSKPLAENHVRLVLVDAMGLLRQCFQLADLAIVAGSYTDRVGGHNILEPLWYGVPTLFGPHMYSQPELVQLVEQYGAGLQISLEELGDKLVELFDNSEKRHELGRRGLDLVANIQGATHRTAEVLKVL